MLVSDAQKSLTITFRTPAEAGKFTRRNRGQVHAHDGRRVLVVADARVVDKLSIDEVLRPSVVGVQVDWYEG